MKRLCVLLILFSSVYQSIGQGFDLLDEQFQTSERLKEYYYGFSLYDVDQNRFVYGRDENKYFTPASNTKVFTLLASLTHLGDSILGLEYIVKGDSLIFWGTGDPTFLHSKWKDGKVFEFLKNQDKELFYVPQETEEPYYRDGWAIEDYDYYYQPDVSVFPIYGNVATFTEEQGGLSVSPSYFTESVFTVPSDGKFKVSRLLKETVYEVSNGAVPKSYNTEKPFIYTDDLFIELLQDTLGRTVERIVYEKPDDVKQIYSAETREVLREMMLPSDNFLAEQLIMMCAYRTYGSFDTKRFRAKMEEEVYQTFTDRIQIRDGCGLSSYNKVTPRSMVELLGLLNALMPDTADLYYLFPTGGLEGTLKGVYALDQGKPFVWAKTGTIHAVHCQSGYIETRSGRRFIYSFLNNNFLGSSIPVRNEMVRLMTYIRQNY